MTNTRFCDPILMKSALTFLLDLLNNISVKVCEPLLKAIFFKIKHGVVFLEYLGINGGHY